jgi:hypothetical protein
MPGVGRPGLSSTLDTRLYGTVRAGVPEKVRLGEASQRRTVQARPGCYAQRADSVGRCAEVLTVLILGLSTVFWGPGAKRKPWPGGGSAGIVAFPVLVQVLPAFVLAQL